MHVYSEYAYASSCCYQQLNASISSLVHIVLRLTVSVTTLRVLPCMRMEVITCS